jgi:hypothetical protein
MTRFTGELLLIYNILEKTAARITGDEKVQRRAAKIINRVRIEVSTGYKELEDLYEKK